MKLIIEIPDKIKHDLDRGVMRDPDAIHDAVRNGILLPMSTVG